MLYEQALIICQAQVGGSFCILNLVRSIMGVLPWQPPRNFHHCPDPATVTVLLHSATGRSLIYRSACPELMSLTV
jgi:hypothetical protein